MHRALAVPDIVRLIARSIGPGDGDDGLQDDFLDCTTRHTMYPLITVNRVFSEPALDTLWERTTPWRLSVLMPPDMFEIRVTGLQRPRSDGMTIDEYRQVCSTIDTRMVGLVSALLVRLRFSRPLVRLLTTLSQKLIQPSVADMQPLISGRFFFYSQRVRHLSTSRIPESLDGDYDFRSYGTQLRVSAIPGSVERSVIREWQGAREALFPTLRSVHIELLDIEDAALLYLITPDTTGLSINVHYDLGNIGPMIPEDLAQKCTGLRRFETNCHNSSSESPTHLYTSICDMLGRIPGLESVTCLTPLEPDVIMWLASIRKLKHLEVVARSAPSNNLLLLPRGCFPILESISMPDVNCPSSDHGTDAALFRQFLAHASPTSLRHLSFAIQPGYEWTDPAPVFSATTCLDVLSSLGRFANLTHVKLRIDVLDANDMDVEQRADVTLRMMHAFTSLRGLQELRIHTNFVMQLHELHDVHWPRLETWAFSGTVSDDVWSLARVRCHLSLPTFLDILLLCPLLKKFTGTIEGASKPAEEVVVQLERLRHPFWDGTNLEWRVPEVQDVIKILRRAVPQLDIDPIERTGHREVMF
jgi:hypothetical protein